MATPVARSTHRHRRAFAVAFAFLALVLVAAIVAALILSQRDRPAPWADFRPTQTDPVERATAIADHVEARYLADDGLPLVQVTAGEDVIPDLPQHEQVVAVAADASGQPFSFEQQSLLIFKLCAAGPACAFPPQADQTRTLTLSVQEAHELALRGLKDVTEASAVIVQLPPGLLQADGDTPPAAVLYFRRKDLRAALERPLDETIRSVPKPAAITQTQGEAILAPLMKRLYTMTVKPMPDSTKISYQLVPAPVG